MAKGDITIGRRVDQLDDLDEPGDYCLDTINDHGVSKRAIWYLLPIHQGHDRFDTSTTGSGLHCITEPPWTFRECDDGSVEVCASIAVRRRPEIDGPGGKHIWHGFLDEGHRWREV